jgi:ATP-dependent DNA helicase RecQ
VSADLKALLLRHWGYHEFRPRQEAIVRAILDGRDAAVVMPTGGGKSLCYQLPAVAMGRTCVVISPLIALMQDQAQGLRQMGIEAAFLNSSMPPREVQDTMRRAEQGGYQLLYLSPERIVRPDVLAWLRRLSIGFFAIDEAHCISEWGHEFRPEYRQLRTLREHFPDVPIAAFTASATRQVRHDILAQLHLDNPACVVMSFHRPNLRYIVHAMPAHGPSERDMLLAAIEHYPEGNLIIYAPTVKGVEETAEWLRAQGVAATEYHGKLDTARRARNQESWITSENRVLVGTLAFGLGINKPDVRAVIHLAPPKSLEQYYQEAGRAGRDGNPADCVLLWRKRDLALLTYFIQQVEDADERQRAWQRYHILRDFLEQSACRHRSICLYFGETPSWTACGACDHCGETVPWTEAKPAPKPRTKQVAKAHAQPALEQALREWRRDLAKTNGVPAYVIVHDATIQALCERLPASLAELRTVPGIGEKKAERFAVDLLRLITEHAV